MLEEQLAAEAAKAREQEEKLAKAAQERADRLLLEEQKLEKIVKDKELRESHANEAVEARKVALAMAEKNKVKKKEKQQEAALALAKGKIDERMRELKQIAKKTQKDAQKKADKNRKKMEKAELKVSKKTQKMENKMLDIQSKLDEVVAAERETQNQLKKPVYKISKDENDDDDIPQADKLDLAYARAAEALANSDDEKDLDRSKKTSKKDKKKKKKKGEDSSSSKQKKTQDKKKKKKSSKKDKQ